jgi:hypothetical protein
MSARTLMRCVASAVALAAVGVATPAWSVAQRTFVASYGNDANPCSVVAPCRSFGAAITQTFFGGEVIVLDSGGYGPVTISGSISLIAAPGVYAGISVFNGQNGVTINAAPSTKVVLRGLTINGQGGGEGIVVGTSGEVHVESCVISGMVAQGIIATLGSYVRVAHTTIRSNGLDGIFFNGAGTLVVDDTQIARNGRNGLWFSEAANATIRRSRFTDNGFDGFVAWNTSGTGTVTVSDSEFSGNANMGVKLWAISSTASPFLGASLYRIASTRNTVSGVEVVGGGMGNVNATVSDSAVTFNGGFGVTASYDGVALVTVSGSAVDDNGMNGINAEGSAGVVVGLNDNSIARNGGSDIRQVAPTTVRVYGTNSLSGGGSDVIGSTTFVSRH